MNIDLRFPLGLLFIVFGVLLTLFGLLTERATYERSLFINVNLWWGLVMLLFGGLMFHFRMEEGSGEEGLSCQEARLLGSGLRLRFYERSSLPITAESVTLLK